MSIGFDPPIPDAGRLRPGALGPVRGPGRREARAARTWHLPAARTEVRTRERPLPEGWWVPFAILYALAVVATVAVAVVVLQRS